MWTRLDKDVLVGALFMLFGLAGFLVGLNYPMGTASRMGPGYFPIMLSGALFLVGAYLAAKGMMASASFANTVAGVALRPALAILVGVLTFAAVERVGLFISAVILVLLTSLAQPGWRPWREGALALILAGFAVIVFQKLLKMPIPVWPSL